MPLYTFECNKCKDKREYFTHRVNGTPLRCEECDSTDSLERRMTEEGFSISSAQKSPQTSSEYKINKVIQMGLINKQTKKVTPIIEIYTAQKNNG